MGTNHLIGEKSPYLLEHAHNPVDWYPWGKIAFEKAKHRDKPVLLSIGYSTCHWCHVMAHESFEDGTIAKMINDHFIAIKVDREERPDIDHIYMTATAAMTGGGGWPLTVFLTPQGDPFYAGTYFPPYAKWGSPGFASLLEAIARAWQSDRENILSSGRSITEGLRSNSVIANPSSSVIASEAKQSFNTKKIASSSRQAGTPRNDTIGIRDETLLDKAFWQMRGQFDEANGGFGSAPKFPMGHQLSFLLRYHKRRGALDALIMVEKTLTAMARGGLWDHLGGGFHRYSTDRHWHVPHFEKMLYDQALLSRAYLEAYQVIASSLQPKAGPPLAEKNAPRNDTTQVNEYEHIARGILDYVLNRMTDKEGGFYSAEDADSLEGAGGHSKEGAFYVFSQPEIEGALGKGVAAVFNYCYGILPQGNIAVDPHGEFKGKNILYAAHRVEEAALEFHKQNNEIRDMLTQGRAKLSALRQQRPRPQRDDKVLCDWNGLMIASFAFAGRVLGEPKYVQAALKAADFILTHMMAESRLLHRWRRGTAGIAATLEDYAFFIYGLLELYEAGFRDKYLDAAQILADGMIEFFSDQEGGFYMTASDAESLIMRPKEAHDGALPSGNSAAALILLKLHALTKKDTYRSQAEALFSYFASSLDRAPHAYSFLLSALDWHSQGPFEITFQGAGDDPKVAKMLKILYKYFIPAKAIKFTPALSGAQARICHRGACQAPIESVDLFESVIAGEAKQPHF